MRHLITLCSFEKVLGIYLAFISFAIKNTMEPKIKIKMAGRNQADNSLANAKFTIKNTKTITSNNFNVPSILLTIGYIRSLFFFVTVIPVFHACGKCSIARTLRLKRNAITIRCCKCNFLFIGEIQSHQFAGSKVLPDFRGNTA